MFKHVFMNILAAGFAAKGLLIHMTSSSVATGLVRSFELIKRSLGERCSDAIVIFHMILLLHHNEP